MVMSPYQNFRQHQNSIFIEPERPAGQRPTIVDTDGSTLYETFRFPLRTAIIEYDDTTALKKYLGNAPWAIKRGHPLGMGSDPFIVAATHGSLHSLRILLDHYAHFMKPSGRTDLDGRCYDVLNTAARCGQLEVVKVLLDHPLLQIDLHHNYHGFTPIMAAADIFDWAADAFDLAVDTFDWRNNLDGKEAVINLFLDRGAHASDADYVWHYCDNPVTGEPKDKRIPTFMALNLAAEWAGSDLIRRLIQSGADPNITIMENKNDRVRTDITIISTASRCANVEALKVLIDCAGKVGGVADAVSNRDSWGSMPLHWACQVLTEEKPREMTAEVMAEKLQRIITTVDLLLGCNPETINAQDMYGNTPLHYAAKTYSNCGRKYTAIYQFLCDRGADASILNKKSETALHCLCHDNGGWPSIQQR
ncbi:hypothetical protein FANTH_8212 [Fusarium anthophilum]|uniref:Ankyrin n=1 Tax=Fusarium anthophilum TaxID=48485 RepID=A0A8H4ZCJ4_9HYPO|nr:hypothetical protein FANTH_8212 [Fusarium anthophilum]